MKNPIQDVIHGSAGFSLVELVIAAAVASVVFGLFASSVTDAVDASVSGVGAADLQEIGRRAMDRIKEDLRSTGRFADADLGIPLPHVFSNGQPDPAVGAEFEHDQGALTALAATFPVQPSSSQPANPPLFVAPGSENQPLGVRECVFRLPNDEDGDGRIVSMATGNVEWSGDLVGFVLIPNARGTLDLVRRSVTAAGVVTDETICRCVEALTFDSVDTKPVLPINAIEVHLHLRMVTTRGETKRLHLATTIAMKN